MEAARGQQQVEKCTAESAFSHAITSYMALMKQIVIPGFFARLKKAMPEPKTELEYDVYQLLVAVVLSAQATDAGDIRATTPLFKIVKTPAQMSTSARRS